MHFFRTGQQVLNLEQAQAITFDPGSHTCKVQMAGGTVELTAADTEKLARHIGHEWQAAPAPSAEPAVAAAT